MMTEKVIANKELLKLNKAAPLWHGVDLSNANIILKQGYFEPRTTQRFWADGLRRKDNDPQYETSGWLYGWSMSRSLNVSRKFGIVVFCFDKKQIQKSFKITPYAWNYSISNHKPNHKRELEEFVIGGRTFLSSIECKKKQQEIEEKIDILEDQLYLKNNKEQTEKIKLQIEHLDAEYEKYNFIKTLTTPKGKTMPLSTANGFFLNVSDFGDLISKSTSVKKDIEDLIAHPMFLGFI